MKSAERVSKDGGFTDVVLLYVFKAKLNGKSFSCGDGGMRGNSDLKIKVDRGRVDGEANVGACVSFGAVCVESGRGEDSFKNVEEFGRRVGCPLDCAARVGVDVRKEALGVE